MKPHPRIRKTIKWGGAVVTVLLVAVWIGGRWWRVSYVVPNAAFFDVGRGRFRIAPWPSDLRPESVGQVRWSLSPDPAPRLYWHFSGGPNAFIIPFWIPTALTAIASGMAWRLDTLARRRARLNLCPKCHYDRTGLAIGAVCPECGVGGAGR